MGKNCRVLNKLSDFLVFELVGKVFGRPFRIIKKRAIDAILRYQELKLPFMQQTRISNGLLNKWSDFSVFELVGKVFGRPFRINKKM